MTLDTYTPAHGPFQVNVSHDLTIADTGSATLPLTCRWPQTVTPQGFVIFCHGLGSNGREYSEFSSRLAAHGYFVVHPTFPDWIGAVARAEPELGLDPDSQDLPQWAANPMVRNRMHEILHTPHYWTKRVRIVRRILDEKDAILSRFGIADTSELPCAIAGHSFGAYTSQLMAGAEIDVPGQGTTTLRDERIRAAVLLSAQGRDQQGLREGSWDALNVPMLTVTGTLDRGAKGQNWEWKSEPFTLSPPKGKYLAVLKGGDHYLGGITRAGPQEGILEQREAVFRLTLAFLDAHLLQNKSSEAWLGLTDHQCADGLLILNQK